MGRIMKQQGLGMRLLTVFVILSSCLISCKPDDTPAAINFRLEMCNFVIELSDYAKKQDPGFLIIPQNGQELITNTGESNGLIQLKYNQAIDATGREDLFYGYAADNVLTPESEKSGCWNYVPDAKNRVLKYWSLTTALLHRISIVPIHGIISTDLFLMRLLNVT